MGGPIAHGFLTLSLLPMLRATVYRVDGVKAGINYGLNRVRFVSPVPAGGRIRFQFVDDGLVSRPDQTAEVVRSLSSAPAEAGVRSAAATSSLTARS